MPYKDKAKKKEYDRIYCIKNIVKRRQRHLDNKEKEKLQHIQYAISHKEEIKDKQKKWQSDNLEYLREKGRQYRLSHKDELASYNQDYGKNRRDKKKKHQFDKIYGVYYRNTDKGKAVNRNCNHKRRAICKDTDITSEWLKEFKTRSTHCALCGDEMNETRYDPKMKHLDHIHLLSLGGTHTMNNVRYLCQTCNLERPKDGSDLKELSLIAKIVVTFKKKKEYNRIENRKRV